MRLVMLLGLWPRYKSLTLTLLSQFPMHTFILLQNMKKFLAVNHPDFCFKKENDQNYSWCTCQNLM